MWTIIRKNMYIILLCTFFICLLWFLLAGKAPRGVPRAMHYCREGEFNLLMLDLLGPSLEDRFNHCGRRFSMRTVLLLAAQMVCVI